MICLFSSKVIKMVHSAYNLAQIVPGCPARIESVASWDAKLLLGCIDGSLRIYAPSNSTSNSDAKKSSSSSSEYALDRTIVGFSKKAISSLTVLQSRNLLLSLSDAIALHRLPSLEVFAYITKTRGATTYAWDDKRGFLCVNKQKKLFLYRYDGSREMVEVKEFPVPDVVKSMAWCGENLCLGIRREYVVLNTITGAFFEVFPCGRIAPPMVVSLPSGELILGKDNIGVLVDQNGKLIPEGRVCWSEAPASIAIHPPYAIARLPRHLEIRSLIPPYQMVQTFANRDVHFLVPSSTCVIVASEYSISGLFPFSIGAQVIQLTASGNFEEALALCKLLPEEESSLRLSKESTIRIRYGHYLFENGEYEEAMEQFLASLLDIASVLSLFPVIKLPTISNTTLSETPFETEPLAKSNSDASDEVEGLSFPVSVQDEERSRILIQKPNHNALMALNRYLQSKRKTIIAKAAAEDTDEVVAAVFDDTSGDDWKPKKYSDAAKGNGGARVIATLVDTALLQSLLLTGHTKQAVELLCGPNYCDVKICEEFLINRGHYLEVIELYRYNELHREALKLLNRLVADPNSLPVPAVSGQPFGPESIIEYLKPLGGLDPALVLDCSTWILEACPEQTIELFSSTDPPLPPNLVNSYLKQHAPHMQVTYLEHMLAVNDSTIPSSLQNELVQIYLAKVLDEYTEGKGKGTWNEKQYSTIRQKFLSALENTSGYNTEVMLKQLPTDALYEEHAFLLGRMQQHELALTLYAHKLHEPALAVAYCDRIYKSASVVDSKKGGNQVIGHSHRPEHKAAQSIYLTLLKVYLYPQKCKKEFDRTVAILRSSKGSVAQKFAPVQKARVTMGKNFAEIGNPEDLYQSLSGTDSAPESGRSDEELEEEATNMEGMMLDEAIDLLTQRWDSINGAQALRMLPSNTKLQQLLQFLEPLLKKSSEARRNFSVIKSLRQSENLQVKDELFKCRKRVVKIGSDSICSLCNKKIGTSVFAVYPNSSTLVHFVCFRDSQNIKAVGTAPIFRGV